MTSGAKIRLFVDAKLEAGQSVSLEKAQAHYLLSVMRQLDGAKIALFNNNAGEWIGELASTSKRAADVINLHQSRPASAPPDLWLCFAPIKKSRTDFIVEKAAELGVRDILPIQTDFTNSERIKQDRLQAHAIEAAEQCAGIYVPKVHGLQKLNTLLAHWPQDRQIIFCDEALADDPKAWRDDLSLKAAIFIGPEGGFSDAERKRLAAHPNAQTVSLGPRILRADTAAVSAITLWQAAIGDWV